LAAITLEDLSPLVEKLYKELMEDDMSAGTTKAHSIKDYLSMFKTKAPFARIHAIGQFARQGDRSLALVTLKNVQPAISSLKDELSILILHGDTSVTISDWQ